MTPEKALELVGSYARLNKGIKVATKAIGENLDRCNGISGKRDTSLPFFEIGAEPKLDSKGRDLNVHLVKWYTPEPGDYDYGYGPEWLQVGVNEKSECPHCYAAHLAVQHRKELRKELAGVKRSMSRSAA